MARQLPDVKQFVREGADVNTVDAEGFSPVLMAAYSGSADIVEYLLECKSNVLFQVGSG
jgi:ankyrin repeat protein